MPDVSTLACDLDALEKKAKGDDSLLALDVLRFVQKWRGAIEVSGLRATSPLEAQGGRQRPLDLAGPPLGSNVGKADSRGGG